MNTVLIVQRRLTQYRIPLFNRLREDLEKKYITLRLIVGEPSESEKLKQDSGVLNWTEKIQTRYFWGACWQPFEQHLPKADLVIMTQENKLLYNHWLLLRPKTFRIAFWGHGKNMQASNPEGWKERYKSWSSRCVDWWFAYTDLSAKFIRSSGFPKDRITTLNNTIDTKTLATHRDSINQKEIIRLKNELGIGQNPVGIFIGSLYHRKRLSFLIQACLEIREKLPRFHLLLVGDGPDRAMVKSLIRSYSWVKMVGAKQGRDKALCVMSSDVMLNPGLIGLGIIDSFVFEKPMITTHYGVKISSPEIAYLEPGFNAIVTANTFSDYSNAVVDILVNKVKKEKLKIGCKISAKKYTLNKMVYNFSSGIDRALKVEKYR